MYFEYQILNAKKKNLGVNGKLILPYIFGFSQFQVILIKVNQSLKVEGAYKSILFTYKIKNKILSHDGFTEELSLRGHRAFLYHPFSYNTSNHSQLRHKVERAAPHAVTTL